MAGEELNRKWHELCGWRQTEKPRVENPGFADNRQWWRVPGGGEIRDRLPNLHEDANLAIAEADRVFSAWTIFRDADGYSLRAMGQLTEPAQTFCEAILRALIASKDPQ